MKKNLPAKHRNVEEIITDPQLDDVSSDSELQEAAVPPKAPVESDRGAAAEVETPAGSAERDDAGSESERAAEDNSAAQSLADADGDQAQSIGQD